MNLFTERRSIEIHGESDDLSNDLNALQEQVKFRRMTRIDKLADGQLRIAADFGLRHSSSPVNLLIQPR